MYNTPKPTQRKADKKSCELEDRETKLAVLATVPRATRTADASLAASWRMARLS